MEQNKPKFWGILTSLAVILYITIGAGYEVYLGLKLHHVSSSLTFIGFSAAIFYCRVMNAISLKNYSTFYADIYGTIVLTVLTLLKLIYSN